MPPRVATLPVDLLRHELFVSQAPVPDHVVLEIVDFVFLPLVQRSLRASEAPPDE